MPTDDLASEFCSDGADGIFKRWTTGFYALGSEFGLWAPIWEICSVTLELDHKLLALVIYLRPQVSKWTQAVWDSSKSGKEMS